MLDYASMKVSDSRLFFLSSIEPQDQRMLERIGNWLLRPVCVLTGLGREYHSGVSTWHVRPIVRIKWYDTVISIATFLPGLIFGTALKFLAHATDLRMRENEEHVQTFLQFKDPPRNPLERAHKTTWNLGQKILKQIAGINGDEAREVWTGKTMRRLVIAFKGALESESQLLFQAFQKEGEARWGHILKVNRKCPTRAVTYSTKYSFLVQLYFMIRKGVFYKNANTTEDIERERRPLFFKEDTPECELRKAFNTFLRTFEKICSKGGDDRLCAIERLDETSDEEPKEFNYYTPSFKGVLIDKAEIQNAILAHQE